MSVVWYIHAQLISGQWISVCLYSGTNTDLWCDWSRGSPRAQSGDWLACTPAPTLTCGRAGCVWSRRKWISSFLFDRRMWNAFFPTTNQLGELSASRWNEPTHNNQSKYILIRKQTLEKKFYFRLSPVITIVHIHNILECGYVNKPNMAFLHNAWLLEAIFKV